MQINLTFDASMASAPVGFVSAIQAAATQLDNTLSDPVTVNLDIGYNEIQGQPMFAAGEKVPEGISVPYSTLVADLSANPTSAADLSFINHLPAVDPNGGKAWFLPLGEEKALGLVSTTTGYDGFASFEANPYPGYNWSFATDGTAAPNQISLEGMALNELSGAIGRYNGFQNGVNTAFDLGAYDPSSHAIKVNSTDGLDRYFSVDGGTTNLVGINGNFDTGQLTGVLTDPFNYELNWGQTYSLTSLDTTIMNTMGFTTAGNVNGTMGNDTLTGTTGDQTLVGLGGDDTLQAGTGTDLLLGGAGNDVLRSGATGADTLVGGLGNDTYRVNNASDIVVEQANQGTDTVNTTMLSYTLGANVENLVFIGTGNSTLTGNSLANVIRGGAGNDILVGGGGNDTLSGGAGSDTFRYTGAGFGHDIITDFNPLVGGDKIGIVGLGITAATFAADVKITPAGVNSLITIGGDSIQLNGVAVGSLSQADFNLHA